MNAEQLFWAIGQVEESRLESTETETVKKSGTPGRIARNLLIAAVIVSMLAVTAFAATGLLLYDSPAQMIAAIFGDETGYDHKGVTTWTDPEKPGDVYENPAYDRVEADPTVVEEDVAPYVSPVGQSISWEGYTLTVDANLYDVATKCGLLTYTLENPNGIATYTVEENGQFFFPDGELLSFNQYGHSYINADKTTANKLTATFYYQMRNPSSNDLEVSFNLWASISVTEYNLRINQTIDKLRETVSEEEVLVYVQEITSEDDYQSLLKELGRDSLIEEGYRSMAEAQIEDLEIASETLTISQNSQEEMTYLTSEDEKIILSPLAICADLGTDRYDSLVITFRDGSQYVVQDNSTANYVFSVTSGSSDITMMFNRLIDIDQVQSVIVNGTELKMD